MSVCRSCGKSNRDGAGFCRYCGQLLGADDNTEVKPSHNESTQPSPDDAVTVPFHPELEVEGSLSTEPGSLPPSKESAFHPVPSHNDPGEEILAIPELASLEPDSGANPESVSPVEQQQPAFQATNDQPISGDLSPGHENATEPRAIASQDDAAGIDAVLANPKAFQEDGPFALETIDDSGAEQPEESGIVFEHPLPPGYVFHKRYRILKVVSQDEDCTTYEAEDLLQCWNCDHVQAATQEVFCENCGAALDQKPVVCLRETVLHELVVNGDQPASTFMEGGYLYHLEPRANLENDLLPPVFQLLAGYQSDTGGYRDLDEDSLLVMQLNALSELRGLPSLHFFAVADGIGGYDAGEIASRITVRSLGAKILENIFSPEITGQPLSPGELKAQLKEAVLATNYELLAAREKSGADMGNTLTAALVRDDLALIVNVGDSRTYLMRMGSLSQITQDHSVVARLLSQNLIQPEEVYTHEQKSVIYRSLGDKPDLEIDDSLFEITLEPGDRLVLCCDGLWEMVPESFIEDVLLEFFDPQAACDKLVEMANQAGGDDNISVIVVNIQTLKRFH
jgi:serine/threonine protein phosphatase PrpC